jgi:hypothetical protein
MVGFASIRMRDALDSMFRQSRSSSLSMSSADRLISGVIQSKKKAPLCAGRGLNLGGGQASNCSVPLSQIRPSLLLT